MRARGIREFLHPNAGDVGWIAHDGVEARAAQLVQVCVLVKFGKIRNAKVRTRGEAQAVSVAVGESDGTRAKVQTDSARPLQALQCSQQQAA